MTLLAAWVLFPLVLGLLSVGCGLALEAASGRALPGPLLLPAGFCVVALAGLFGALGGWTMQFATPVAVALAVAGFGLALPRRLVEGPALAAAAGVYAVFAAPVLASGRASFAGYIKLDDTATYFAMLDRAIAHGYDTAGLPSSTYEATLNTSLVYGYPLGSFLPLGMAGRLVGEDIAWLWQPYLTFLAVALALALYQLVARVVARPWSRALVAFVGAQAALIYGYVLWGGVKEIAAAMVIVLAAALLAGLDRAASWRATLPLAVACAVVLGMLSVGGAVWLLPLGVAAVVVLRTRVIAFAAAAAMLAIPAFSAAATWLSHTGAFTGGNEFGNLGRRLSVLQVFGVWPSGDFRSRPPTMLWTYLAGALVVALACLALAAAWRARAWELPAAVATAAFGCLVYVGEGSPWVGGKALACASPIVLAAGVCGAAMLVERGLRVEGGLAGLAIAGVVLWSNVLQYHAVDLAPTPVLAELASIGDRYAGQGPTLLTDFQAYGARHFLRNLAPEAASELRRRQDRLRTGEVAPTGVSVDIDELQLDAVLVYRTLVLRTSTLASRPPSVYQLVSRGRYYDVWQMSAGAPRILEHLSLGSRFVPAAVPRCADVLRLARLAAANGGRLATVERPATVVVEAADGSPGPPAALRRYGEDTATRYQQTPYTIESTFRVSVPGDYGIWIGGTFQAGIDVAIDGTHAGGGRGFLDWPSTFVPVGSAHLDPGVHTLTLRYHGPDLRPGTAGVPEFGLGPIAIGIDTAARPVTYVEPANARSLCGRRLDWVEAIAS